MYDHDSELIFEKYSQVEKKSLLAEKPYSRFTDTSQSPVLRYLASRAGVTPTRDAGEFRDVGDEANRLYANFMRWNSNKYETSQEPKYPGVEDDSPEYIGPDNKDRYQAGDIDIDADVYPAPPDMEIPTDEPMLNAPRQPASPPNQPPQLNRNNPRGTSRRPRYPKYPQKESLYDVLRASLNLVQEDFASAKQVKEVPKPDNRKPAKGEYFGSDLREFLSGIGGAGYRATQADVPDGSYTAKQVGQMIMSILHRDRRRRSQSASYWKARAEKEKTRRYANELQNSNRSQRQQKRVDNAYGKANFFRNRAERVADRERNSRRKR